MRRRTLLRFCMGSLILLIMATGSWILQSKQNNPPVPSGAPAPRPVSVAIAVARRGDMPVYLDGLGSVIAYNTVTVRTRVDGQLMKIFFEEGQYLNAGEPLAEIDPRPFEVQLEQAEGQMARDQASLANARVDLERYRTLVGQEAIPEQQLATQESIVRQSEAVIESDQAAIDNAKLQLVYCHITAPIGGRIGLRLVDVGNIVHASDPNGLLVITQLQPIAVLFTLPEDSLSSILTRMRTGVPLTVEAYNRDRSKKLETGKLLTVDNAIDPNTGTMRLKSTFENPKRMLFPNEFVNVRLLLETKHGQVIIPSAAIQRGPQGTYVYIVTPDKAAEIRTVTPAITEGDVTSISKGIQAGEIVVTDGTDKLQPGSKVAVKQTAAVSNRGL